MPNEHEVADFSPSSCQTIFMISFKCAVEIYIFFVSGWYFGKTAGVFGTMDNEPSTDFLTPRKTIETDLGRFARSWALEPQKCVSSKNFALQLSQTDPELLNLCESFFKSKTSQFSSCFPVVSISHLHNCTIQISRMYSWSEGFAQKFSDQYLYR